MDAKERIIRKLLLQQQCHRCESPYDPESVLILARRSEVWMVMASCSFCEQKDTFVIKFPVRLQGRRRVTSYRLSRPPSSAARPKDAAALQQSPHLQPAAPSTPVTFDDVLDMHEFLKDFNGDFHRLFAEID